MLDESCSVELRFALHPVALIYDTSVHELLEQALSIEEQAPVLECFLVKARLAEVSIGQTLQLHEECLSPLQVCILHGLLALESRYPRI
jgi:hypothetical protein